MDAAPIDAVANATVATLNDAATSENQGGKRMGRVSMKDRCFMGDKSLFLDPTCLNEYNSILRPDIEAKAKITGVGLKQGADFYFQLVWSDLPVEVQDHHVRKFLPRSFYNQVKELRQKYDVANPEDKGEKRKRGQKGNPTAARTGRKASRSKPPVASMAAQRASSDRMSPVGLRGLSPRRSRRLVADDPDDFESSSDEDEDMDEDDNQYNFAGGTLFGNLDPLVAADEIPKAVDPNSNEEAVKESNGRDIEWNFENVDDDEDFSISPPPIAGNRYTEPARLRDGVAASFDSPMEAFAVCGGFNREFVKRLTANSNQYVGEHR